MKKLVPLLLFFIRLTRGEIIRGRHPGQVSVRVRGDQRQHRSTLDCQGTGVFSKYNLDPQLIFIIAGRAAQAMLSGEIKIGIIGATHVANVVTSGGDLTMLLALETKLDSILVVHPSINSAEGLNGKKVALGTPAGTMYEDS